MGDNRYHTFLSHNSDDKPAVEELAHRLRQEGIEPWLDKWNLVPGEAWQPALEQALDDCDTCTVFIGPSGFGPWQNEEMRAAIGRRVSQTDGRFRVIPVLLPGGKREERSRLPTFLTATTWVEFRKSLDDDDAFHRLLCGIRGIEPGPGAGSIDQGICPYRGLQAFLTEHARFFFGREALTEWLLDELRPAPGSGAENRFLAVIGASGSGKSSLARAGLVPALKRGELDGSQDWPVVVLRPGQEPLESLAVALAAEPIIQKQSSPTQLMSNLAADQRTLHLTTRLALHGEPETGRVVVLVDQFEEIFTLCTDDALRRALIDNLLYAARVVGGQALVVLTMRADFYGKCAAYDALAAALSDHQVLIGPMSDEELRRAIERPAQIVGCELEAGLTEILIRDAADQAGALPLLQHALEQLWERRDGRRFTFVAYQQIGGLAGALERRANEIFDGFNPADREICRRVFLRLTQPGEGTEDTKRRANFHELVPAGGDAAPVEQVVQRLAETRLITTEGDEAESQARFVEVAHEALIRGWSKLRGWIDSDRESLRIHRRLSDDVAHWQSSGRDNSYLYGGARLAQAREWAASHQADMSTIERSFLQTSRRRARRGRIMRVGTTAVVIVSLIGLSIWALDQKWFAEQSLTLASNARDQAHRDRDTATVAQRDAENRLYESLLAQARARRLTKTPGRRFDSLEVLRVAAQIRKTAELRDEAIACLSLTDARSVDEWVLPVGFRASFSRDLELAVLWDLQRTLRVRRWGDEEDIFKIPPFGQKNERSGDPRISPDNRYVSRATRDNCEIWEIKSGERVAKFAVRQGEYSEGDFSADGKEFAIGASDGSVYVHDLTTGETRRVGAIGSAITYVRYQPTSQDFAAASHSDVHLISATSGEVIRTLSHSKIVMCLAWSPDGKTLATGSHDFAVKVWEVATGARKLNLEGHSSTPSSVAYSADGSRLFSSSWDGTIRLWNVSNGESLLVLPGRRLAVASDSLYFVSATGSDAMGWVLRKQEFVRNRLHWSFGDRDPLTEYGGTLFADGRCFAMGTAWGTDIWDVATEQYLGRLSTGKTEDVRYRPSTSELITTGGREALRWPVHIDQNRLRIGPLESLVQKPHDYRRAAISSDESLLAVAVDNREVLLVDLNRQTEPRTITVHYWVRYVDLSPDGELLATGGWKEGGAMIWDVATGELVRDLKTSAWVLPQFSLDGKKLLTSEAGVTTVWEVGTWLVLHRFSYRSGNPKRIAISPDGRLAAIAGMDNIVLIDLDRLQKLTQLPSEPGAVTFGPSGARLVRGRSTSVSVWELGRIRQELRDWDLDWDLPRFEQPVSYASAVPFTIGVSDDVDELLVHALLDGQADPTPNSPARVGEAIDIHPAEGRRKQAGKAIAFNGRSSRIRYDLPLWIPINAYAACGWVYLAERPTGTPAIFDSWHSKSDEPFTARFQKEGLRVFHVAGGDRRSTKPVELPVQKWTHLAIVKNGKTLEFYVNGRRKDRIEVTSARSDCRAIYLGNNPNAKHNTPFKGRLQDFRFYGRALSPSEIRDIFKSPTPQRPRSPR